MEPLWRYLVVSGVSLLAAGLLFHFGGEGAAAVAGKEYGLAVKLGGAPAAFVIFLWVSHKVLGQMLQAQARFSARLAIKRNPTAFPRRDEGYQCTGLIFNRLTNEQRSVPLVPHWEAGVLTLNFDDLGPNDWIGAKIEFQGQTWHVDIFSPMDHVREV